MIKCFWKINIHLIRCLIKFENTKIYLGGFDSNLKLINATKGITIQSINIINAHITGIVITKDN
jgi:hypothetical protein